MFRLIVEKATLVVALFLFSNTAFSQEMLIKEQGVMVACKVTLKNNVLIRVEVLDNTNSVEDTSISIYTNSRSSISYLVSSNSNLTMSYSHNQMPIELISIQRTSAHKLAVTDKCNIIHNL